MRLAIGALLVVCLARGVGGCFEGGANFHQQQPGNNDKGGVDLSGSGDLASGTVPVGYGEIAVDAAGAYFLSSAGKRLLYGDLQSGEVEIVNGVDDPQRLAFAYQQPRFYVTTGDGQVLALSATTRAVIWRRSLADQGLPLKLYVSRDDQRLIVAGYSELLLLEAASGDSVMASTPGNPIRDVDFLPDSTRAVVTLEHSWPSGGSPSTRLLLVRSSDGATEEINVPNCSSNLVLSPNGSRGFLAPTNCNKDPISVVDLVNKKWLRNLPGFGPVEMASDGTTAVGFIDTQNLATDLFDDPASIPSSAGGRYHLMLLNTQTLTFSIVVLGDDLPRYTLTPDGKVVLVDNSSWVSSTPPQIRVLDVSTRSLVTVSGPAVNLDHFVISPGSEDVYLLSADVLYRLSIPQRVVKELPTPFVCRSLNITPDGTRLLLIDGEGTLQVYALEQSKVLVAIKPPTERR